MSPRVVLGVPAFRSGSILRTAEDGCATRIAAIGIAALLDVTFFVGAALGELFVLAFGVVDGAGAGVEAETAADGNNVAQLEYTYQPANAAPPHNKTEPKPELD